jgi:type II secretion system protein H
MVSWALPMTFPTPPFPAVKPLRLVPAGFTLIELILVMTLLTVASALVLPNLASFFRGRTLDQEARRLLSLTHYAQSRAVAEGVPIELWFDATTARYGATISAGFSTDDPRAVAYDLDADISLSLVTEAQPEPYELTETFESTPDRFVVFLPDGLVQPDSATLLRLEHTDGNALTVALNAMGTSYEILSDDDLAQP